jgi:hypothetical protein
MLIQDYFKPLKPGENQLFQQHERPEPFPPSFWKPATIAQRPPPGRSRLLDLPRHVFKLIMQYLSADLNRDCAFPLNKRPDVDFLDEDGKVIEEFKPEWDGMTSDISDECRFMLWQEVCPNATENPLLCECPQIYQKLHELLTCCRAFWLELSPLVFSQN